MASGFPLQIHDVKILTSEALYQVCRFPHMPDVQQLVIKQKSPMTAKMQSRRYRSESRPDWNSVRVRIMRWCLEVKLAQNWDRFGALLRSTGELPIVEFSRKDAFWGAKPQDDGTLVGANVLGRLLMELRDRIKCEAADVLQRVEPVPIQDFSLYGKPIDIVQSRRVAPSEVTGPDASEAVLWQKGEEGAGEIHEVEAAFSMVSTEHNVERFSTAADPEVSKPPGPDTCYSRCISLLVEYLKKGGTWRTATLGDEQEA